MSHEESEAAVARCPIYDVHALEVVVTNRKGSPASGVAVALYRGGNVCRSRTRSDGCARFEGLAEGDYQYSLELFDRDLWSARGGVALDEQAARGERAPRWLVASERAEEATHEVAAGECLIQLAHEHGTTAEALWEHNASLHAEQRQPRMLVASEDTVRIPPPRQRRQDVRTGQRALAELDGVRDIELELLDEEGRPKALAEYFLSLVTTSGTALPQRTGKTDGAGVLREWIPADVAEGELLVRQGDGVRKRRLRFGLMAPATRPAGVRGRLANLGYAPGDADTTTAAALLAFRRDHALESADDETVRKRVVELARD
ncbi:hypothetical protein JY651_05120 [Pyxidicoccus parkwayensis]|uniref:Uncharacterized protein n=1 Tax=Pyxidicoccus parkwayensis TaxID=2813578 RepID=A0ABX7NZI8_9BACT|nr:hypothetical protein [Pyxidicoccus parkwaysis]QSQ24347.1 hypothetical protein JY651_05120 [Pyxidicoccus parkwaysis]